MSVPDGGLDGTEQPDEVTEAMNPACRELGDTHDEFVSEAARRTLERSEW